MLTGFKKFESKNNQANVLRISKNGKLSITAKHRDNVSRLCADIFFNADTREIAIKFYKSMKLPYSNDWKKRSELQSKQDAELGGDFEVHSGELNLNPILREYGAAKLNESVAVTYRIEGDYYILSTAFLFANKSL